VGSPATLLPPGAHDAALRPSAGEVVCNDDVLALMQRGDFGQALVLRRARLAHLVGHLLSSTGGNPVGVVARSSGRESWVCVLPEMSEPELGCCRLQYFDRQGFCGHRVFGCERLAVETAVAEGYTNPDPGAVGRVLGSFARVA
jgi:hypothetical protein